MAALRGKVAFVTGSSRGIGAAIAMRFALEGAAVAVHGRDEDALERTVGAIRWEGGKAMSVTGDVTCFAQIEAMRCEVERTLGPVDVLGERRHPRRRRWSGLTPIQRVFPSAPPPPR